MGDEMMGLGMGGHVDYARGHENAFDYCKQDTQSSRGGGGGDMDEVPQENPYYESGMGMMPSRAGSQATTAHYNHSNNSGHHVPDINSRQLLFTSEQ